MARSASLSIFLVLGALIAAQAAFDCTLYETTCVTTNITAAYTDCAGTVAANTNNVTKSMDDDHDHDHDHDHGNTTTISVYPMECREEHLSRATADNASALVHCPHAAEEAVGPCVNETLAAPGSAAFSTSSMSFAAFVTLVIAVIAQM